jgi:hypothetical protein
VEPRARAHLPRPRRRALRARRAPGLRLTGLHPRRRRRRAAHPGRLRERRRGDLCARDPRAAGAVTRTRSGLIAGPVRPPPARPSARRSPRGRAAGPLRA